MADINRLGLGTMGMHFGNRETSIKTIHAALDSGITLFNTGEFYNGSESEMVTGEALKGIVRDRYFLSVKYGVLPSPGGGIYGLDNNPFHVKAHLAYSLRRLGLEYVDLYQPARQDTEIPVEEVVGAIAEQVKTGYVRHIGLSMVNAETLRRACKVHPIHTVEMTYSLIDRSIEKGVMLSQLALAWSLAKYDHVQSLIGTTNPEHLMSAVDALTIKLTDEDIVRIEAACPADKISGRGMRNFVFTNGRMSLGE